jgi:hypothetical protein
VKANIRRHSEEWPVWTEEWTSGREALTVVAEDSLTVVYGLLPRITRLRSFTISAGGFEPLAKLAYLA